MTANTINKEAIECVDTYPLNLDVQNENTENRKRISFFDLLSALQKDIRRGNEYEALHWAVKLETYPTKDKRSRFTSMLWNRLKVIASEDIGPAYPLMPLLIETLEKQYRDAIRRKNNSYRLFLTNAVVNLCHSRKSRETDDLLNVVYGEIQHEDKRLPIPEYAIDKHTVRGKMKNRDWDHFFSEGTELFNGTENPYTETAKKMLTKYGPLESTFHHKKRIDPQITKEE